MKPDLDLMAIGVAAVLAAVSVALSSVPGRKPENGIQAPTTVTSEAAAQGMVGTAPGNREFRLRTSHKAEKGSSINGTGFSAEDLWDQTVYDAGNNEIGTVTAVTEPPDGDRKAIVKVGTTPCFDGKHVSVPVQRFRMRSDGRLVVDLTGEEFERMPNAPRENLPAVGSKP